MNREQFTFYESFFKAISRIKKKADRADAYDAVCNYALYGTEPDLDAIPDTAAMAYIFSKPILDASRRKAESGKKGGDGKQTGSKPEANGKQTGSKPEARGNRKQEKEQEKEQVQEQMLSPISPCAQRFIPPTFEQVAEYARMRRSSADPKPFFEYYDSAGWRDSEGKPVYNWQQKFIAWEMREQEKQNRGSGKKGVNWTKSDEEEVWKYV